MWTVTINSKTVSSGNPTAKTTRLPRSGRNADRSRNVLSFQSWGWCGDADMMERRAFLSSTLGTVALGTCNAQSATAIAQHAAAQTPSPLVWPIVPRLPAGVRSFAGHADTVLDVIGRIGAPASLVIFTEGNHLMVLSSDDIVG